MGRIGIGPDAGDEWIGLDQDRYMASRGYFRAEDGGYYSSTPQRSKCGCDCVCHDHLYGPINPRKEKSLTKKQKAAQKKAVAALMRDIKQKLFGKRPPVRQLTPLDINLQVKKTSRKRKTSKRK